MGGGQSKLTDRMAQGLIDRLPHESVTKTKLRDSIPAAELAKRSTEPSTSFGPWSHTDYLLAAVMDRLDNVTKAVYEASGRYKNVKRSSPYVRPGLPPETDVKAQPSPQMKARIENQRADHRAAQAAARAAKGVTSDGQ